MELKTSLILCRGKSSEVVCTMLRAQVKRIQAQFYPDLSLIRRPWCEPKQYDPPYRRKLGRILEDPNTIPSRQPAGVCSLLSKWDWTFNKNGKHEAVPYNEIEISYQLINLNDKIWWYRRAQNWITTPLL
jgi:hypothetical protein